MEIINDIDRALGCHVCGVDLDDSVSNLFCSQECQEDWHAARTEPLQGYEEPYDLPQHAVNQIELRSPETTPETDTADYYDRLHHIDAAVFARALAGGARRRRTTHTLYLHTNPDRQTSWLQDAVRAQAEPVRQALSDTIAEWVEQYVSEAPALSHATVNGDGTVTWHLEPWQRSVLDGFDPRLHGWRDVIGQIRADVAGAVERNAFRRLYLNGLLHATQCEHEDQAVVDPARAHALELRRNRNTGPAPRRRRPPRDLGPRR